MESLYLIVPIAVLFCAGAIAAWLWASRSGQFEDLDREAHRILEEDSSVKTPSEHANHCETNNDP